MWLLHGTIKRLSAWRCLSDDVSIFYLQDILVHPDYKRVGIGKKLMQYCLKRFSLVRTKVLLTDDELPQKAYYESFGFKTPGN